jgi:hypothetical protein
MTIFDIALLSTFVYILWYILVPNTEDELFIPSSIQTKIDKSTTVDQFKAWQTLLQARSDTKVYKSKQDKCSYQGQLMLKAARKFRLCIIKSDAQFLQICVKVYVRAASLILQSGNKNLSANIYRETAKLLSKNIYNGTTPVETVVQQSVDMFQKASETYRGQPGTETGSTKWQSIGENYQSAAKLYLRHKNFAKSASFYQSAIDAYEMKNCDNEVKRCTEKITLCRNKQENKSKKKKRRVSFENDNSETLMKPPCQTLEFDTTAPPSEISSGGSDSSDSDEFFPLKEEGWQLEENANIKEALDKGRREGSLPKR